MRTFELLTQLYLENSAAESGEILNPVLISISRPHTLLD